MRRMASSCVLCFITEQSHRRKRLYSPSSSHVLAVLTSLAARRGVSDVLPVNPSRPSVEQPPYMCRKCFTLVEKVHKTRADLVKLEDDVAERLARAAAVRRQTEPNCEGT